MDFDFYWIVIFFFFVVLPLLEKLLKGGKGTAPPPRRRMPDRGPPRTMHPPREREPHQPAEWRDAPATTTTTERSERDQAADLIPADLWEILTGEKRPPVRLPPSPEPDLDEEFQEDEESEPIRPAVDEEKRAAELILRRDRETAERRSTDREPPVIVSLETEPLAEPLRHAAFHRELDKAPHRPAIVQRPAAHRLLGTLDSHAELRRAVVLQEILGPPKGLE